MNLASAFFLRTNDDCMLLFSLTFAWFTALGEVFISIAILLFPKRNLTHYFIIVLFIGVYFTRLETGFLIILAILSFSLIEDLKLKKVYIGLISFFSLSMISGYGFY